MALGDTYYYDVSCVGRNDSRDLGVCAIAEWTADDECSPYQAASTLCAEPLVAAALSEWGTDRCACMAFHRDGALDRGGWVVPDTNCLAYRALYPGQVECYDDAWNPLP